MRFSYMETFKLFRIENPDITISFMKFYTLRPKNIKPLRNTPMLGCLCVYCLNVKLKLIKLKIPEITDEYSLYDSLICKKGENQEFRNSKCIFNDCNKCSDWENKILSLVSHKLDDKIEWSSHKTVETKTKANKDSKFKRKLPTQGTVAECAKQLIEVDVIRKLKSKKN